jgi:ABC-type multidrug transport system permease subunit
VFATTQVAAMLVTFLALMTPSMFFSGMITPIASMDAPARAVSRLIPASYFMAMARGVFLKGLGFSYYGRDLLTLAAFGGVVYCIAILRFRKRAR